MKDAELEIPNLQPWGATSLIVASDGFFSILKKGKTYSVGLLGEERCSEDCD